MAQHKSELMTFLHCGSERMKQMLEHIADKWQLSTPELRILLFLEQNPTLDTARDVALHCGMSKASVSGNVLKLATRGLLTVDVDLKDRRFQHLTVTALAEPILAESRSGFHQAEVSLTATLNQQEQEQLRSLLKKLNDTAHAMTSQPLITWKGT